MKFYTKNGNVQPIPNVSAFYAEAVRLERLLTAQSPYPQDVFNVIYKRTKTCEEWLWRMGDQNTSCAIRNQLKTFFREVQNGNGEIK